MKVITEAVAGSIVEDDGRHALLLHETSVPVHLIYGLVTLGPGEHVFPGVILDDWGKEITGLQMYSWIREKGNHFPRAEVFAVGPDGKERQHFLREFELYAPYPVYVLKNRNSPISSAVRVHDVLVPDDAVTSPVQVERPATVTGPLASAQVTWWSVPAALRSLDFLTEQTEAT